MCGLLSGMLLVRPPPFEEEGTTTPALPFKRVGIKIATKAMQAQAAPRGANNIGKFLVFLGLI